MNHPMNAVLKRLRRLLPALLLCLATAVQAQDYDTLITDALALRNAGDLVAAEALLRQARPLAANTSEVDYLLGMVLAFQQRFEEGLALIDQALTQYPDNLDLQLGRARILAFQGRHAEAAEAVAALRTQHPDNLDAINLAGRIALYRSQAQQALTQFDAVLAVDPRNLEALIGRYDAAQALDDADAAEAALLRAEAVAPDHMDVRARRNPETAPLALAHELSVGYSRSEFSLPGFSHWNDRFVEYRRLRPDGNQHYLRASHNHRFALHDTQLEVGGLWGRDRRLPLELAVGLTEDADFSADWFVRAGTRLRLNPGAGEAGALVLVPLYQFASFDNGDTHRVQFGLEYYLPGIEAWLAPVLGVVRDQDGLDSFAWSLSGHWQISTRHRVGINYSDAPETENLLTTDTKSYGAYWRLQLADTWSLLLVANRLERSNSYDRDEVSVVLQHRF